MNEYMNKVLYEFIPEVDDCETGFIACHDILLPLLREALPRIQMLAFAQQVVSQFGTLETQFDDKGLAERIKQVVED